MTSAVFRLHCTRTWHKLTFLASGLLGTALALLAVPWLPAFALLLPALLLAGFAIGCFDVADNGLFVYMLGPDRSKPYIQSLHAAVALGFTLGLGDTIHVFTLEILSSFKTRKSQNSL